MPDIKTTVSVKYQHSDSWHIFSSRDIPGLYVASQDPKKAYDDVGPSIQLLLELNEGIKCRVSAVLPYADFVARMRGDDPAAHESDELVLSDRRFEVVPMAA